MNESLEVSREGRVLRLTLARVDKRNALNVALCRELVEAVRQAEADREISVLLLDAHGPVFCAGMDLDETLHPEGIEGTAIHEELFTLGARLRKPLIAAVQGPAYGGGVGLVANAHIVVASDDAKFALTEIRLALWPFVIYRALVAAMGERRALQLSLTARTFSASEAERWGLVHEVVPGANLASKANEIATTLAEFSPEALVRGLAFTQAGEPALQWRAEAFASADFREGVEAFQQKRKPRWPSLEP